jgi:hypothetical protein
MRINSRAAPHESASLLPRPSTPPIRSARGACAGHRLRVPGCGLPPMQHSRGCRVFLELPALGKRKQKCQLPGNIGRGSPRFRAGHSQTAGRAGDWDGGMPGPWNLLPLPDERGMRQGEDATVAHGRPLPQGSGRQRSVRIRIKK